MRYSERILSTLSLVCLSFGSMARPGSCRKVQVCQVISILISIALLLAQICSCMVIRSYKDLKADRSSASKHTRQDNAIMEAFKNPHMIPVKAFRDKMRHLRSYRDIVRIFYGDYLPDRAVDDMLSQRQAGRILPWQEMVFDDSHIMDQIQAMQKAQDHWDEMTYSPHTACAPKPECVHIAEINKQAHLRYFPSCTVIYKCSQSPCVCEESHKCVPREADLVTRHFIVVRYIPDQDSVQPQSGPYVKSLTFENHTRCACSETRPLHRCPRCPYPFNLTRDAPSCECGCHYQNEVCINIRRGKRPLPEESLSCIKSGRCSNPSCEFGIFTQDHLKRGYCPTHAEMELLSGGWDEEENDDYYYSAEFTKK